MLIVIWFIAIALLFKLVGPRSYDYNAEQLHERYKENIMTLQLVERPVAGAVGANLVVYGVLQV